MSRSEESRSRNVVITGLPVTCNPTKVRLEFIRKCNVDIVEIKISDGKAVIIFKTSKDANVFRDTHPKTLSFGGKDHHITIVPDDPDADLAVDALEVSPFSDSESHEAVIECDQVYNWCELPKLPAGRKGIIIQNITEKITPSQIKEYFENEPVSHGGPVSKMVFLVDGILVLFEKDLIAENVWKFRPHRISEEPVSVFCKAVPEYYNDRFVVETGNNAGDETEIRSYLEKNFGGYVVKDVRICPTQFVVVTFRDELGQEVLKEIGKKFEHDHKHEDQVRLLPKTDCLRVEGVKRLSDAEILTLFENKDRTGGGRITRLDHVKGNAVLLYFASFEDAERIFDNFGARNLSVLGNELKIFRYYHCLYENHYNVTGENGLDQLIGKPEWPQANFVYGNFDQTYLGFLEREQKYVDALNGELKGLACAYTHEQGLLILLNMDNDSTQLSSSEIMITHKCRRIISNFRKRYTYFPLSDLDAEVEKKKVENISIWHKEPGKWLIFGPREVVEKYFIEMNNCHRRLSLKPEEMRWIFETKAIDRIRKFHPAVEREKNILTVRGQNKQDIERAQASVKEYLKNLRKQQITNNDKSIIKFLLGAKKSIKLQNHVHDLFGNTAMVILIVENDHPYLYGEINALGQAFEKIEGAFTSVRVEFTTSTPSLQSLLHPKEQKLAKLQENGLIEVSVQDLFVEIAGFRDSVKQAKEALQCKFGTRLRWERILNLEPGIAKYMIKFDQEFKKICRENLVTFGDPRHKDGKIILTGGKEALDKVFRVIPQLCKKVVHNTEIFRKRGITKFISTGEGENMLETVGSQNNTVAIAVAVLSKKTAPEDAIDELPFIDAEKFQFQSLSVTIRKGDITEAKTDAIVISVLPSFNLSASSMSKAILKKAGLAIQTEIEQKSDKYFRQTSGGQLPCTSIFHVALQENLSATLVNVLEEADRSKFTSISLPAIGTGGAGKSGGEMAGLLVTTFHDFAKQFPTTNYLKTVDIVVREQRILKQFLDTFVELQTSPSAVAAGASKTKLDLSFPKEGPALASPHQYPMTFGKLQVSIRQGNIIDETNDAIVNSVGADFNLSQGLVSRAILEKEGNRTQQKLYDGNTTGKHIQVTDAKNLQCKKKIIHVVAWRAMNVEERITRILGKAEERRCQSISIPAIGTGKLGVPFKECSKLIRKGITTFVGENLNNITYLQRVDLVIFDKSQLQQFEDGFFGVTASAQKKSPSPNGASGPATKIVHNEQPDPDGVSVHFFSKDHRTKESAYKQIKKLINDAFVEKDVKEDMIPYLKTDALNNIIGKTCIENKVSWEKSPTSQITVVLKGFLEFVEKARNSISGKIVDYADQLLDGAGFAWEYKTSRGDWKNVDPAVCFLLEEQFKISHKNVTSFTTCGKTYGADLAKQELNASPLRRIPDESADETQHYA